MIKDFIAVPRSLFSPQSSDSPSILLVVLKNLVTWASDYRRDNYYNLSVKSDMSVTDMFHTY